jgi:hypothetical protein
MNKSQGSNVWPFLLFLQRIREFRSSLDNETTTVSTDDVHEYNELQANDNKIPLGELDSGISESELCQTTADPISSKSNQILQPLSSSSDVESGIGDSSPNGKISLSSSILQHRSSAEINDLPTLERIALELNSIAIDWRSYHTPAHCTCALPFDSAQRKVWKRKQKIQ